MGDFDIIIEGKRFHCTKAYVELDDSIERSETDCTKLKLKQLTPTQISATMSIDKKSPNYERMCELFESLRGRSRFAEGE